MSRKLLLASVAIATMFALGPVAPDLVGISKAYAKSSGMSGGGGRSFGGAPRSAPSFGGGGRSFGGAPKANATTPAPKASAPPPPPKPTGVGGKYGGVAAGAAVGVAAGAAAAHAATPAPTHEPAPAGSKYGGTNGAAAAGGSTSAKAITAQPPKTPVQQQLDKAARKADSKAALAKYQNEQQKFKAPPKADYVQNERQRHTVDAIKGRVQYRNPQDYYARRGAFYEHHNNWQPPAYAYNAPSSFGMWDAAFLWLMLDNVGHNNDSQYRDFYYAHKDDPGMQEFRKEVERLSADNADLKTQIAALDASAEKLKSEGKPVDPTYVPPDAIDVALAAHVAEKEIPVEQSGSSWAWWLLLGIFLLGGGFLFMRSRT